MKHPMARQLIEKNGIDAEMLLDLLTTSALEELSNYYFYTLIRTDLIGVEGETLRQIVEDMRIEDRNHFEVLVPRIYELGGTLPVDAAGLPRPLAPADTTDSAAMVEFLMRTAERAVKRYTRICDVTTGKDNCTHSLALAIMHEEIEHQVWLLDFMSHRAQGEGRKRRAGSPFVSKLMQLGGSQVTMN